MLIIVLYTLANGHMFQTLFGVGIGVSDVFGGHVSVSLRMPSSVNAHQDLFSSCHNAAMSLYYTADNAVWSESNR